MQESDWESFLERLVEQTKSAVESFAAAHPGEEVCYFAYDSEPRYGYVLTCFDTSQNSWEFVRKQLQHNTHYRRNLLDKAAWFDNAYYQAKANALLPFCNNTGDFAYQGFTQIQFPEWGEYAESAEYPVSEDEDEDYLTNRVARLFCRATDRLVDQNVFAPLRLARPTLIGFGFHDHDQFVVNMLNAPDGADSGS